MPIELPARRDNAEPGPVIDKPLTGRHVLAILVVFFAVIITVNMVMMTVALRTMPGVEVKSAYEASQRFNGELDAIAAQDKRGWQVDIATAEFRAGQKLGVVVRDKTGEPINGLDGVVRLDRPTDKRLDQALTLRAAGGGRYEVVLPELQAGQWDVTVEFTRDHARQYVSRRRIITKG